MPAHTDSGLTSAVLAYAQPAKQVVNICSQAFRHPNTPKNLLIKTLAYREACLEGSVSSLPLYSITDDVLAFVYTCKFSLPFETGQARLEAAQA